MVTGNEDFPTVGQLSQPLIEVENCGSALAERGEVARVDQDIPVRDVKFTVQLVRVGHADGYYILHGWAVPSLLACREPSEPERRRELRSRDRIQV